MHDSSLSSFPPSGTVYRFTSSSVGLIKKATISDLLDVYPNPFVNEINFSKNSNETFDVEIIDELGRNIASYYSTIKIDTQLFQPGIYRIIIKDKSGGTTNKKLIKVNI